MTPATGSLARLVHMANQIARNLEIEPGADAATARHITDFWDPRMKRSILAHVAAGGEGLSPVARAAIDRIAASA